MSESNKNETVFNDTRVLHHAIESFISQIKFFEQNGVKLSINGNRIDGYEVSVSVDGPGKVTVLHE